VADVQFSTLGTVLLGTLARLARATGTDKELKTVARRRALVSTATSHARIAGPEDVGEVLSRNKDSSGLNAPQGKPSLRAEGHLVSTSKKPKDTIDVAGEKPKNKKRKKKKDAIDNLFEGLL
jgi:ribonuclease MRP protein subunit RMP1